MNLRLCSCASHPSRAPPLFSEGSAEIRVGLWLVAGWLVLGVGVPGCRGASSGGRGSGGGGPGGTHTISGGPSGGGGGSNKEHGTCIQRRWFACLHIIRALFFSSNILKFFPAFGFPFRFPNSSHEKGSTAWFPRVHRRAHMAGSSFGVGTLFWLVSKGHQQDIHHGV